MNTHLQTRRQGNPLIAHRIWDSIKQQIHQRQTPTLERISKFCTKSYGMNPEEVEQELRKLVDDGLVVLKNTTKVKGCQKGDSQDTYRLPVFPIENAKDKHDWYCFACHKAGEVILCDTCFRVFHPACLDGDEESKKKSTCPLCLELKKPKSVQLKNATLNQLLTYTCNRLRYKFTLDKWIWKNSLATAGKTCFTTDRCAAIQNKRHSLNDSKAECEDNETWRAGLLLYNAINLSDMESKADRRVYKSLTQFRIDAATIVHNAVIFYGEHSSIADMARVMYRDCVYDLGEIIQCKDCYMMSNQQVDKNWFCQPCNPPHELAYAKHKGYPYWPAKIIKVEGNCYDVRFFGGNHERAVVDKSYIRPISVNIHTLQVKRTSAWNKACEELRKHQDMLANTSIQDTSMDTSEEERNDEEDEPETPIKVAKIEIIRCPKSDEDDVSIISPKSKKRDASPAKRVPKNKVLNDSKTKKQLEREDSSQYFVIETPCLSSGCVSEDLVTSSCNDPELSTRPANSGTPEPCSSKRISHIDSKKESHLTNRKAAEILCELERLKEEHTKEIEKLKEAHRLEISETKKKQWCYNCELEAIYHCCWNTAYCSTNCQQVHWQREHKKLCRRKR